MSGLSKHKNILKLGKLMIGENPRPHDQGKTVERFHLCVFEAGHDQFVLQDGARTAAGRRQDSGRTAPGQRTDGARTADGRRQDSCGTPRTAAGRPGQLQDAKLQDAKLQQAKLQDWWNDGAPNRQAR
jgi:hypothetical protein